MKSRKFTLEIFLVLLLALICQVLLSVVYVNDFSYRSYKQYEDYASVNLSQTSNQLKRTYIQILEELDNYNYTSVTEDTVLADMDYIAEFQEDDGLVALKSKDGIIDGAMLNRVYYNEIKTKTEILSSFSSIYFNSGVKEELILTFPKEIEGGYILYSKSLQNGIDTLVITGFDNFIVSTSDNVCIYSYLPGFLNTNLASTLGINVTEITDKNNIINLEIQGVGSTMVVDDLDTNISNFKIIAYVNSQQVLVKINDNIQKFAIVVAAMFIIAILSIVFCIVFYIKRYNNLTVFKGVYPKLYRLHVNASGGIILANRTYKKEFGNQNIQNFCIEGTLESFVKKNISFPVELRDLNGETRFLNFVVKNAIVGYILIGGNSDIFSKDYYSFKRMSETNQNTGLYNVRMLYSSFPSMSEGAILLLEVLDIDKYRNMFGAMFVSDLRKSYGILIEQSFKEYGTLYDMESEYVLAVDNQAKYKQLLTELARIISKLEVPMIVNDNKIKVEIRAGVVELKETNEFKNIMDKAKFALSKAKTLVRDKFTISHKDTKEELLMYNDINMIEEMIRKEQLDVYFQPQLHIKTNKIVSFEALCRIKGGDVSILQFIEQAEREGYMMQIGEYIAEKAMQFAKMTLPYGVTTSINISPIQMLQMGFTQNFLDRYNKHGLTANSIAIEITETFLMSSFDEMVEKLNILRGNGIEIHLDDFGIGFSSMLYLKKLPISTIKLDKEFIKDIDSQKYSKVIIRSIIDMAKSLELETIAEGVETQLQLELLEKDGCDIIQGYLLSKAITKEEAIAMLEKQSRGENILKLMQKSESRVPTRQKTKKTESEFEFVVETPEGEADNE